MTYTIDIIGQDQILNNIQEQLASGNLSHSYIFSGQTGIGKLKVAEYLAMGILCEEEDAPCGHCRACQLNLIGEAFGTNHPDFHRIVPEKTSSKASIKKKTVEELIEDTYTKPYYGSKKIYLIEDFDLVTIEGQNALLKTLEEPLDGIYLLLVTDHIDNVLETVRSRCQIIEMSGIESSQIKQAMLDRGVSEFQAETAATFSGGAYRRGNALIDNSELIELRQELYQWMHRVVMEGGYYPLEAWQFFKKREEDFNTIFYLLESWARDLQVLFITGDLSKVQNQDISKNILEEVEVLNGKAMEIYGKILKAREYIENNGNKQLVIEAMLLYIGG